MPADAAAGTQTSEDDAALREAGVPEDQIAAGRAELAGPVEGLEGAPLLWPDHADAFRIFKAMRRQWRMHVGQQGQLLYAGLDLAPMDGVRRMLRIRPRPELMDQLNVLETAGAQALNEAR